MDIRDFLEEQYQLRKARNSRFTIRAFSQLLKTDSGSVVKVLQGNRRPGKLTIEKWLKCLKVDLDPEVFLEQKTKAHFAPLAADLFEKHYSWVHPIFMESLRLKKVSDRKALVCSALGLTDKEYEQILEFLVANRLVKVGRKKNFNPESLSTYDFTVNTEVRRAIQKKYLNMAIQAVDEVPLEQRCHSTLSVGIAKEDIPKVKEILRKTRMQIGRLSKSREKSVDSVYNVSMALYPVIRED